MEIDNFQPSNLLLNYLTKIQNMQSTTNYYNTQSSEENRASPTSSEQKQALILSCPADQAEIIGEEVFLLCSKIIRYNKYGWKNTRYMTLTQDSILLLKQKNKTQKELRLRLPLENLKGLTLSLHPASSEMVLHCEQAQDIRITVFEHRQQIVDTLKMFFAKKKRDNLSIFGVRQKQLGMYTTSESDAAKGISRIPLPLARLAQEDLVDIALLVHKQSETGVFNLGSDQAGMAKSQKQKNELLDVESDEDPLNKAFSILMLQQSEVRPTFSRVSMGAAGKEDDGTPQVQMVDNQASEQLIDQRHKTITDGTPEVLVVKQHEEELEAQIEHRKAAKERSLASLSEWKEILDRSSFQDDSIEQSQLLYSRSSERDKTQLEEFQLISMVGRGSFGKVYLAYLPATKRYYALKSIRKDMILDKNSIQNIDLERLIMLQVDHPFIVNMQFVFQRTCRVYFVLDYVHGGELFQYMRQIRRFDEPSVVFYASQIALALSHLHSSNIMYRDLKPENILVERNGYIKLSDFGLAKIAEESNTFCGTPEYISPEMLLGTGHDHTADWWALGVLIYEMLCGIPPFYDKNRNMMFLKIEQAKIKWPDAKQHGISVSKEAQDLITRLLEKDKSKRLGAQGRGNEVLAHPFFKSIDLNGLIQKKIPAPFIPKTTDPELMRQSQKTGQVVRLKEFQESVIPDQNVKLISEVNKEFFRDFGVNIDETAVQRATTRKVGVRAQRAEPEKVKPSLSPKDQPQK